MVAEPAGELPEIRKRRSEIEIGANLCLSYRFAPALYRYGLSTVYNLSVPLCTNIIVKIEGSHIKDSEHFFVTHLLYSFFLGFFRTVKKIQSQGV